MRNRRLVQAVGLLCGVALLAAACGGDDSSSSDTTGSGGDVTELSLAYVGPLTGDAANLGILIRDGAKVAVEQFNDANKDFKITLKEFDTQGDPAQAPGQFDKYVDDDSILGDQVASAVTKMESDPELGVVYAPFDEDFGYVTLEAFLARKPVITATDAGGPLEFVVDGENGAVVDPTPEAVGAAFARLHADRAGAAALGDAGHARAAAVTWDGVIDRLVGA